MLEVDDIRRLSVLAVQAAVAIQTMQRLKAAEHHIHYEGAIRKITAELQHAPSMDPLLKTAVNALGQRLQAKHVVLELDTTKDTHEPQRNSTA